jgi:hypothetical protein
MGNSDTKPCRNKDFIACKPKVFKCDKLATDALRWIEEMEITVDMSDCRVEDNTLFASQSFKGEAHIWWKTLVATRGREKVYNMECKTFRKVFLKKCVPERGVEKLEEEYLHLEMEGTDSRKYTSRFLEITGLIPNFAGSKSKIIGQFTWGAHPAIQANIRTTKPHSI